jgi:ABC-type transporter Mla subunit MlaD
VTRKPAPLIRGPARVSDSHTPVADARSRVLVHVPRSIVIGLAQPAANLRQVAGSFAEAAANPTQLMASLAQVVDSFAEAAANLTQLMASLAQVVDSFAEAEANLTQVMASPAQVVDNFAAPAANLA